MPRRKYWKKATQKKNKSVKADVGDKCPTDVGYVQPSVPLGVGHVLTPMTSVPAGVISTTPVTVGSADFPETTLNQTTCMSQMIPQNSSQLFTQNISQITVQNELKNTVQNIPQKEPVSNKMPLAVHYAVHSKCIHQKTHNLVFGSFHQGSSNFSSFSRGNQCTCNSLMMLSKAYKHFSFTGSFLDHTLVKGDNLYNTVAKNLQNAGQLKSKLLMFDELPIHINSGENHHIN